MSEANPNFPAPGVTVTSAPTPAPAAPDPGVVPAAESQVPAMDPRDAEIAQLKAELAAQNPVPANIQAPPVDPRDSEIAALRLQVNELLNRSGGAQVTANTTAVGMSSPDIQFNQIEPGVKWAVSNGLVSVDDVVAKYGEHMRALLSPLV